MFVLSSVYRFCDLGGSKSLDAVRKESKRFLCPRLVSLVVSGRGDCPHGVGRAFRVRRVILIAIKGLAYWQIYKVPCFGLLGGMMKNLSIVFLTIGLICASSGCNSSTAPDPPSPPPPPPDNSKYYDLLVEYIRPVILRPEAAGFIPAISIFSPEGGHVTQFFSRVDDYHFNCEFLHVKAGLIGDYHFHQLDQARYDGVDDSSVMVGEIYFITVKQTGVAKELKDVRSYNFYPNPYQGPKARAAFFTLTTEGVIVSNPQ